MRTKRLPPLVRDSTQPRRRRWLLRLAIVLAAGLAFYAWTILRAENRLTIQNRSGQAISELKVNVAGQTSPFQDIASGQDVVVSLGKQGAGGFDLKGKLADGNLIHFVDVAPQSAPLVIGPGGAAAYRKEEK